MLVLVWIGVYWMWQPTNEQKPLITFAQNPVSDTFTKPQITPKITDEPDIDPSSNPIIEPTSEPLIDQTRLIPPEFTEHIVQPNELMQAIAKHYFGSIDDWTIIAKANPSVDPQKLKPGMVLRIPVDKTNIQGKIVGAQIQPGVITSHTDPESKVIEYVVRSGDSLSVISQRIYGSSHHARFIYESNRDILRSMDSISIGQLLKLPPLPDDEVRSNNDSDPNG